MLLGLAPVGFVVDGCTSATNADCRTMGVSDAPITHPHSFGANIMEEQPRNPLPQHIVNRHIDTNTLELYLRGHPQPHIVNYVLTGLRYGFDLGFNGILTPIHRKNNKSARDNPKEITQAIAKELTRGHTAGPFPYPPFPVNHFTTWSRSQI